MKRLLTMLFVGTVISFFYFPVGFTFMPASLQTKIMLAALGVAIAGVKALSGHVLKCPKSVFWAGVIAFIFGLSCYLSINISGTDDMTFVTYPVSFFTWMFGAYAAVAVARGVLGHFTLRDLTDYLAGICVVQCALALMIDNIPAFQAAVDSVIIGTDFMKSIDRMYGIGCGLDTGGIHFAVTLILMAHRMSRGEREYMTSRQLNLYIFSFIIITAVGCMIARTTITGTVIGLAYLLYREGISIVVSKSQLNFYRSLILIVAIAVAVSVVLYNSSPEARHNLRFAFEGFFNWAETGTFRTDSTDKLNNVMWIWPENLHDWIWGTGIFGNWFYSTDIGYCRYILYCGLVGFSIFSFFFVYNSYAFAKKFDNTWLLALCLLTLCFVVWVKVATDLLFIYALAYSLDVENEEEECEDEFVDEVECEEEPLMLSYENRL